MLPSSWPIVADMVTLVVGRTPLHLLIAGAMRHEQRRFMGRAPTIAGKKSATDAKKAILFGKLGKELVVTSKATNGDVNNIAKTFNMPRDKIEAAIKRGVDGKSAAATETILYEGTGPSGSALMVGTTIPPVLHFMYPMRFDQIEALTDNRKRTAPALRHILSKHGGALGANGSVAWMFERKGYLEVSAGSTWHPRPLNRSVAQVKQPEESSLTWDEDSVMNIAVRGRSRVDSMHAVHHGLDE
ncbi:hypothetical protein DYB32_006509 [Aphanomyces invadans]|uniref:Uncharacterized protein n=1 Tax=Aphanomyces invadans TaxID=157072 RepID=A0A3R6Z1W9_9STRA|nr:hypothetical protein DYB32_006509 [Aphanomyces invadans]